MQYSFFAPAQIEFGWGAAERAGALAQRLGRRAWIVLGSRRLAASAEYARLLDALRDAEIAVEELTTISREPEVSDVDETTRTLVDAGIAEGDFLLGVGGGAAIDLAKAVAAMATNRQSDTVRDYLEGVGRGLQIEQPPLPLMAIPTTAGTGSEATKNAVISSHDPPFKKSLRSPLMVPDIVLVDPQLTVSLPAEVTAHSGMDAITQCIESYISRRAQPIPQALAVQGLRLALPSIREAIEDPQSRTARERMAHAALLSGMALANSGLGMAHGVAASLGIHARIPHGLACAVMLPPTLQANRTVARRELLQLAQACGHLQEGRDPDEVVDEFIRRIGDTCRNVGIPTRLSDLGVVRGQLPAIVASSRGNSMNGNPRDIADDELQQILEALL